MARTDQPTQNNKIGAGAGDALRASKTDVL